MVYISSTHYLLPPHRKCPQVIHLILQRGQYVSTSLRRPPKKKSSLTTPYSHSQLSLRPRPSRTSLPPTGPQTGPQTGLVPEYHQHHRASLPQTGGLPPEYHQHHSAARRASSPLSSTQPDVIVESGDHVTNRWSLSREQLYASQGHLRSAESMGYCELLLYSLSSSCHLCFYS